MSITNKEKYCAFLRGINVGGHHKVPMANLRAELEKLDFENVETLLNSGNILFDAAPDSLENLQNSIAIHLESAFSFPIPTILRPALSIARLVAQDPFKDVIPSKDIRLYVSFLTTEMEAGLQYPWTSEDTSLMIIGKMEKSILSFLDLSISSTPKAMGVLERYFGKDITTRNWNTILKLEKKIVMRQ